MNKQQKKIKNWYEQNEFWHVTSPILFRKAWREQAPEEVENIISLLGCQGQKGRKILDLCCGVGRHSIEFARRGFHVTGVDISTEYLNQARRKARKARVKIEFIKDDMRRFCRCTI